MKSSVVAPRWYLVFTKLTRDTSRPLTCFLQNHLWLQFLFSMRLMVMDWQLAGVEGLQIFFTLAHIMWIKLVFSNSVLFRECFPDITVCKVLSSLRTLWLPQLVSGCCLKRQHWCVSKLELRSRIESTKSCLLFISFFKELIQKFNFQFKHVNFVYFPIIRFYFFIFIT